jgi:hypothetical protein
VLEKSRRANETHYLPTLISALQATGATDQAHDLAEWNLQFNEIMWRGQKVHTWVNHFALACALSALNRDEEALASFEKLLGVPGSIPRTPWIKDNTCFRKFQNEPRYRDVVSALDARLAAIRERLPATLKRYGLVPP